MIYITLTMFFFVVMPMFLLFGVVGVALVMWLMFIQQRLFVFKLNTDTDWIIFILFGLDAEIVELAVGCEMFDIVVVSTIPIL
jgi:hypothetical protein